MIPLFLIEIYTYALWDIICLYKSLKIEYPTIVIANDPLLETFFNTKPTSPHLRDNQIQLSQDICNIYLHRDIDIKALSSLLLIDKLHADMLRLLD